MDEPESTQPKQEDKPARRTARSEPKPQAQPTAKADQPLPDLPVSQLIEDAAGLLGYSPWVAAGALREHDGDEMMNVNGAKTEIDRWLNKPVEVADWQED